MAKKLAKTNLTKKRGRPVAEKNPEEEILSNGLYLRQWERIKDESGTQTPTAKLRSIVDWYFSMIDMDGINEKLEDAARKDRASAEAKIKK